LQIFVTAIELSYDARIIVKLETRPYGAPEQRTGDRVGRYALAVRVLLCTAAALACAARMSCASSTVDRRVDMFSSMDRRVEFGVVAPALRPAPVDGSLVVSIVAADIDGDGDLDVIATDRLLQLIVWTNDGSGHFTRQQPRHTHTDWEPTPISPTVDDRESGSLTFVQTDVPFLDPDLRASVYHGEADRLKVSRRSDLHDSLIVHRHAPRAPPDSLLG
jgi:hypothetical protein